jgi:hypothetical protein
MWAGGLPPILILRHPERWRNSSLASFNAGRSLALVAPQPSLASPISSCYGGGRGSSCGGSAVFRWTKKITGRVQMTRENGRLYRRRDLKSCRLPFWGLGKVRKLVFGYVVCGLSHPILLPHSLITGIRLDTYTWFCRFVHYDRSFPPDPSCPAAPRYSIL